MNLSRVAVNEEIKTSPNPEPGKRRLYRSVVNRRVAGVCGGVAEHFNIDPLIVRLVWFLSIFAHGIGLFAYVAAWIIIPESHHAVAMPPPARSPSSQYVWGGVLIVLGVIFLADRLDWNFLVPWRWHYILPYWFNWGVAFSVFVILLGVMLIFRSTGGDTKTSETAVSPFVPPATTAAESPSGAAETTGSYYQGEKPMGEKRLVRALDDRMIGGVCGGLAKYLNIDPSFVRIGFVLLTIFSGMIFGIVTYIVMMIVVPEENAAAKNPVTPVGNT
jgi:phage shock protein PspC (stress-responsive transcriptional regulator)